MKIRVGTASDIGDLAALYAESVRTVGPQLYSAEQIEAWASFSQRTSEFRDFILGVTTFVAHEGSEILGFSGLGADGHIASLYVRGTSVRTGVGSALLRAVLDHAHHLDVGCCYVEASAFAKPLFEKFGFETQGIERVLREGVHLDRYLMRKDR